MSAYTQKEIDRVEVELTYAQSMCGWMRTRFLILDQNLFCLRHHEAEYNKARNMYVPEDIFLGETVAEALGQLANLCTRR